MFEKTLMTLAAAAAIAAAAGVAVVAAAFALYALLTPWLGNAGAAALVAACAALLVLLCGLVAAAKAKSRHTSHQKAFADAEPDLGLVWKIVDMAKQRPLIAAAAALAAGIFAMRNPAMIAALVQAFLAGKHSPPPRDRT